MTKVLSLVVLPLAIALSAPASAAVTTTVYKFVATDFSPAAPQDDVPGEFALRFDSATNQRSLQFLNVVIDGTHFSQQNSGLYAYEDQSTFALGANVNGVQGVSTGSNDFLLSFDISSQSSPTFYYTTASSNDTYFAGNVIFREVTAVPEVGTWAMMVGGLGLAGGMMRRRKVRTAVSFA